MFSTKLDMFKFGAKIVTGVGVSKVVRTVIENNTTTTNMGESLLLGVGTVVIGSMVSDAAKEHVIAQIDNFAGLFNECKEAQTDTE